MEDQQKNDKWSVEQQVQELAKRGQLVRTLIMAPKVPDDFEPGPDDVIIAVPPKNGATWLSHLCHQIRMKGEEPNFETQFEVMRFLEGTEAVNVATQQQPAKPNMVFSHLPYPALPKGGKLVFSFRNQKDALMSAYHFLDSLLFLKGRVALPIFANLYMQQLENHINDLLNWWEHRHDDDVMLLFYDDLKEDRAGCVRRIAKYMGVDCDEDTVARVVHTTSHAEMFKHSSKFDKIFFTITAEAFGEEHQTENGKYVGRVRKSGGKSGEGKEHLPVDIQLRIDQLWQEIVTTKLGFKDLDEMREAWKKERCAIL